MMEWYKLYMRRDDHYWQKRVARRQRRRRFFQDLKRTVAILTELRYGIDMGTSEKQAGANPNHDPETPQTK